MANGAQVSAWRRRTKERLIAAHGGVCVDCGIAYPPFVFDFDHRDPATKSFTISTAGSISYERQYEESLKCDLVCANCHRMRTHIQRCDGCEHCQSEVAQQEERQVVTLEAAGSRPALGAVIVAQR